MEATDEGVGIEIVELAPNDVTAGLKLSAEAGWNQSAADWAMMLKAGKAFGVRDGERLVASGLALPYPPLFGWVSMVLVAASHRRRGLATALLGHAIDHLKALGLTPMLDATPAGRTLYLRLGFQDVEPISRWRSPGNAGRRRPDDGIDLASIMRSDHEAFGADRSVVLADLAGRPDAVAVSSQSGAFLLSRAGRTATQIGPVVADTPEEAAALVERAVDAIAGPLLIDVPDREAWLGDLLSRRGFGVERSFMRMAFGHGGFGTSARLRAIAGPELG